MTEKKSYISHQTTLGNATASRSSSRLISTRDLPVNWENWEDHVFFGSAVARIRSTKTYIQETFPFDGTKKELNQWRLNLDGWQNYILEKKWAYNLRSVGFDFVPGEEDCNLVAIDGKNLITLNMENLVPITCSVASNSTSQDKPSEISAIYNIDFSITDMNSLQRRRATSKLNPVDKPISIEFWFSLTNATESVRGIATHRNEFGEGWTITAHVGSDGSVSFGGALSVGRNGTTYAISCGKTKNSFSEEWNHVCVQWSSNEDGREISIFINGELQELLLLRNDIKAINGRWISSILDPHWLGWSPSPQSDLSGTALTGFGINGNGGFLIDEYRIWHKIRNAFDLEENRWRNVWAEDGLVLQYRFNDSVQTKIFFQNTTLPAFLDSSGNQLHGIQMGNLARPATRPAGLFERGIHHPSLYPFDTEIDVLLNPLYGDAEEYDLVNPNHIVKLIPPHLLETESGSLPERMREEEIENENYESAFYMASLLYTWADFWDGLKIRADYMTESLSIQPDGGGTPRPFLRIAAKEMGVNLPMIFEDILPEFWDEEFEKIQENSWRRILISLPFVLKRKGTLEGINSLFSAIGNNQIISSLRLREYGKKDVKLGGERLVQQNLRFCELEAPVTIKILKEELI